MKRRKNKAFVRISSISNRTGRKGYCPTCRQTVLVVRSPGDAQMPVKGLPTERIRLLAVHLKDLKGDFLEAATGKVEFDRLVSSIVCEQPKQKPWEVTA